ncbi:MAG: ATP-binding protein [Lysobacteraceae bacterium]
MSLTSTWNDWPLTRKSVVVVAGPLLLLLFSLVAIYGLERQTAKAEEDVRRTLQIVSDLHEAHSLLAETAAGVRGYVLVNQTNFLEPYYDAEPRLLGVVERLAERARSGPRGTRYAALVPLFRQKLTGWQTLLQGQAKADPDWLQARLIEGKRTLDVLRTELRVLGAEERSELEARTAKATALRQRNLAITLAFALLGGLGAVMSAGVFAASLSRRLRHLAAEASRLGAGADMPMPTRFEADELGHVRERLYDAGTLLRARAAQLDEARREAETANGAKTEFLSRMSHELRTPLNAILGYAQILVDDDPEARAGRFGRHIETAGRHLLGLITEVLDVARIEAGALTIDTRPVALRSALSEALDLLRPQAERDGIQLDSVPEGIAFNVLADPQRLRQVLLNLIGNAIKFNRPKGRVQFDITQREGLIEMGVRDEGVGLDASACARLFRPFERIESTAHGIEGTGLGLALSKRLIEAMSGQIGVSSAPGHGSRFWIRLPIAHAFKSEPDPLHATTAVDGRMRNVLLVEDNTSNRALLETLFERRPQWRLVPAMNLAEARQRLASQTFDAVLLDLRLPDGDGASLLSEPPLSEHRVPVLVLSADATEASKRRLLDLGAQGFLTKPLDMRAFFGELDKCLQ